MKKGGFVYLALAVMALAVLASLPLDIACKMAQWSYPDFEVHSSVVHLGSDLSLYPSLSGLRRDFVHAAWVSLALAAGAVACRGREEREDVVIVALACLACLAALLLRFVPFAIDGAKMLEDLRSCVVACYAPLCYTLARVFVRHLGRRLGAVMHMVTHVLLVMCCAWDGAGYALAISVPNVAWMALCWTLFALPELREEAGGTGRPAHASLRAMLTFAVQVVALSSWRLIAILVSLGNSAAPDPGRFDYNWLIIRMQALAALPTASYRDLVADPSVLDGLQRLPLAWLGASYGPVARLVYATLLLLFLVASWAVWQDARGGRRGRMIEVLSLGLLLSNLWGIVCSALLLTSTGVVTLLSGNPFQLVPLACLLALEIAPSGDCEVPAPWKCHESVVSCGPPGIRLLGPVSNVLSEEGHAIVPIAPSGMVPMGEMGLSRWEARGDMTEGGDSHDSRELQSVFRIVVACALTLGIVVYGFSRASDGRCEDCHGSGLCQACGGSGDGCRGCSGLGLCASCRGTGREGASYTRATAIRRESSGRPMLYNCMYPVPYAVRWDQRTVCEDGGGLLAVGSTDGFVGIGHINREACYE